MRIVYFGSGAFGAPTLRRLLVQHEVALVVTQPDRPAGRHRILTPTPIAEVAASRGIATVKPEDVSDPAVVARIHGCHADAYVVIAFGQKLGRTLLQGVFAINLHASLLPNYRGAAPINWAMINGEVETGLSVIAVADRMDTGAILSQAKTLIDPLETAGELHDRLALMGPQLIAEVLNRRSAGELQPVAQDERHATRAPKLNKADGTVHFNQPARMARCRVHGLTPWPGCWIKIGDRKLRLHRVKDDSRSTSLCPSGMVLADMSISCADGTVHLLEVQPPDGKVMTFQAYVNGHRIVAGERCAPV